VWIGVALAAALAAFASPLASSLPDGLERVAIDLGFVHRARARRAPAADYETPGLERTALGVAVSGVAGVLSVALLAVGLGKALR
jgi:cobalt/nickel transport protein